MLDEGRTSDRYPTDARAATPWRSSTSPIEETQVDHPS